MAESRNDAAPLSATELTGRWALGLMSGTSLDGIDAALIRSDGLGAVEAGPARTLPYEDAFRARLRGVLGAKGPVAEVERELTLLHAAAVDALLRENGIAPGEVGVIGFHGHTILHAPEERRTWQIGDGALLAAETGIDVVADFRSRDVAEGGQGAPFVPLYHAALAAGMERPLAVLNLGGVGNVTWIGMATESGAPPLVAFDTGPGNALIDDWVARHGLGSYDRDGALAASGRVDERRLSGLLENPYFERPPPKSLDRLDFTADAVGGLSPADGAATLAAFTAASVAAALPLLPAPPRRWVVTGGGRRNPAIMGELARRLGAPVVGADSLGWDGDALEAQAFAYLAVRSCLELPLSMPGTTGVSAPTCGGRFFPAPR